MTRRGLRLTAPARVPCGTLIRTAYHGLAAGLLLITLSALENPAQAQEKKPNILVIMGDDIGWFNIGAYHQGIMSGKTPNLDQLAKDGMRFTDYYAEASCTAGRANFITGELPLRTGLTRSAKPAPMSASPIRP